MPKGWRSLVIFVVNLDNNRGAQVAPELRALRASEPNLSIIAGIEATGNDLPLLPGMDRVVGHGPSRGNIAAYVHKSLLGGKPLRLRWHDMKVTWPRTDSPGPHPPRSHGSTRGGLTVIFAHIPPKCPGSDPARQESIDALVNLMAPWTRDGWKGRVSKLAYRMTSRERPRILLLDANGASDEICRRANLRRLGDKSTEAVLYGGDIRGLSAVYQSEFVLGDTAVPFRGDHGHVLRVEVQAPAGCLPKEKS